MGFFERFRKKAEKKLFEEKPGMEEERKTTEKIRQQSEESKTKKSTDIVELEKQIKEGMEGCEIKINFEELKMLVQSQEDYERMLESEKELLERYFESGTEIEKNPQAKKLFEALKSQILIIGATAGSLFLTESPVFAQSPGGVEDPNFVVLFARLAIAAGIIAGIGGAAAASIGAFLREQGVGLGAAPGTEHGAGLIDFGRRSGNFSYKSILFALALYGGIWGFKGIKSIYNDSPVAAWVDEKTGKIIKRTPYTIVEEQLRAAREQELAAAEYLRARYERKQVEDETGETL